MLTYKGIEWYYYQGALLPRVASHYEIFLTKKEQKELLKISQALFLRYTNEWDRDGGEFWYVIKDAYGGMEELSSNTRSKVRRGIKRNRVERLESSYIAKYGYKVYMSAFNKYKTFIEPLSEEKFAKQIEKSEREYFGVFDQENNKLVAYSENFMEDSMCHYSTIKFNPAFQKNYTSYALIYEMNRYYLNEEGLKYVNDGARSISHETKIQEYLIDKFRFRRAYVRLNIAYRWDVGLMVQLLYPFKGLLEKVSHPLVQKIVVILNQEKIRRSFE